MPPLRYRSAAGAGVLALLASVVLSTATHGAPSFAPGRVLVGFRPGVAPTRAQQVLEAGKGRSVGQIPPIGVHVVQLPEGASEVAAARAFGQRSEVAFAEPDGVLAPDAVPNDPYYSYQWHLPKIGAPTAWNTTTGSPSVTLAILDTGVDGTHPDLAAKMVPGWNFYDNNADTRDVHGHGTSVAGAAGATGNNGAGMASPAWGCKLMPLRISDTSGLAYFSTMATALTWAADRGARVANLSYGASESSTVTSAAQYFQGKGGVVTISAGNSAVFHTAADNPYVLTVSATNSSDVLTSWSDTGNNVDLSAPGESIYTLLRGGGYGAGSGTSFSAPVVAGVAALVISVNPALTASQVQSILKQSADDLGPAGWDPSYGWGRVNAARAVSLAGGAPAPTGDTSPPTVGFIAPAGSATVSGSVSVQISATDDVGVASVTLKVDGATVASASLTPYIFAWDSATVTNGTRTLTATATDAAGNAASAQLTVTVNNVAADTTAPTIAITAPAAGSTVSGTVSVLVNAADNVRVAKVELYVDGKLTATSTAAPFTTKWNTQKAARGPHTLQCKAYDAAGNVGASAVVTVNK
jgi:thermitase